MMKISETKTLLLEYHCRKVEMCDNEFIPNLTTKTSHFQHFFTVRDIKLFVVYCRHQFLHTFLSYNSEIPDPRLH